MELLERIGDPSQPQEHLGGPEIVTLLTEGARLPSGNHSDNDENIRGLARWIVANSLYARDALDIYINGPEHARRFLEISGGSRFLSERSKEDLERLKAATEREIAELQERLDTD
jgi:hypothetical protein